MNRVTKKIFSAEKPATGDMSTSEHVIEYDCVPVDIKHIYQLTNAVSIRASTDGHWMIKLKSGTNAVTVESAIRSSGIPAFNGAPYLVTLRAITEGEIPLFGLDDQAILRQVVPHAGSTDHKSVISRLFDNMMSSNNVRR